MEIIKCNCRSTACYRDGGIGVATGDLLQHWHMQHGRTLHRKELEQARVRDGMSSSGDLSRLQPRHKHEQLCLVPP